MWPWHVFVRLTQLEAKIRFFVCSQWLFRFQPWRVCSPHDRRTGHPRRVRDWGYMLCLSVSVYVLYNIWTIAVILCCVFDSQSCFWGGRGHRVWWSDFRRWFRWINRSIRLLFVLQPYLAPRSFHLILPFQMSTTQRTCRLIRSKLCSRANKGRRPLTCTGSLTMEVRYGL